MIEVSVPGSAMLLGEHAVLHGYPAIVQALDQSITIRLIARDDQLFSIHSDLGVYQAPLDQIKVVAPFEFMLTALGYVQAKLDRGFELHVESQFSDKLGYGSSAAVTVATLSVIHRWLEIELAPLFLFKLAKKAILAVQGRGSGADVAGCVFGGTVYYQLEPLLIEVLAHNPLIRLIYSGYKTSTAEVIRLVDEKMLESPDKYQRLFAAIGECAEQGKVAIAEANWVRLGDIFNKQQVLMRELGVSDPVLDGIVCESLAKPEVLGAKISGSGLGDCVVMVKSG